MRDHPNRGQAIVLPGGLYIKEEDNGVISYGSIPAAQVKTTGKVVEVSGYFYSGSGHTGMAVSNTGRGTTNFKATGYVLDWSWYFQDTDGSIKHITEYRPPGYGDEFPGPVNTDPPAPIQVNQAAQVPTPAPAPTPEPTPAPTPEPVKPAVTPRVTPKVA
jgi:hypothetical protein